MAKLDELDPRWVVEDREDGQNVNDWHWSEKDITNRAKKVASDTLTCTTLVEDDTISLRLLALRGEIEGEAVALNRRGKRGVFFDFDIKLEWQGEYKDRYGYQSSEANGLLTFNVDQHSIDEISVDITTDSLKTSTTNIILNALRTKGVSSLKERIQAFYTNLRCKYDPTMAKEIHQRQANKQQALLQQEDAALLMAESEFKNMTVEDEHNQKIQQLNQKTAEADKTNENLRKRKQELDEELKSAQYNYTSAAKNDQSSSPKAEPADRVKKSATPPSTGILTKADESEAEKKQKQRDEAFLAFLEE
eukprot:TRINITY_DN2329_c1_g2_i1.p1 TRINITY_DN2329_c1_g2~~TRINITY_DN2329_c1_g2_i1.p1  ORF type:complete len:306 (+),score=58.77 TRINITY_DN2329_c1_g2_i1:30-947(+)